MIVASRVAQELKTTRHLSGRKEESHHQHFLHLLKDTVIFVDESHVTFHKSVECSKEIDLEKKHCQLMALDYPHAKIIDL